MEAALTSRRATLLQVGVGLAAIAFLLFMMFSGGPRESGQLVRPETVGLMREQPDDVDRVEVETGAERVVLVRKAGRWMRGDRDLPRPIAERLQMSLRFMHAAEPVRTLTRDEYAATPAGDFGLDPPRYSVLLSRRGQPLLRARFGAPNPQEVLQYARVDGRDAVYLMPRFVGREWEAVMAGVGGG